jgi:CHRD domain-containing protein
MKPLRIVTAGLIAVSLSMVALVAAPQKGQNDNQATQFNATLAGIEEVPSVSTGASGSLKLTIAKDESSIEYELSFSGLQGVVAQSHIHIARPGQNGGIVLWLCQGTTAAPAAIAALTPTCPGAATGAGTVSGVLSAQNITPVATQQILAGDFDEIIALIRAGAAYANVHSNLSPGGEIRGQLRHGGGDNGHGGDR